MVNTNGKLKLSFPIPSDRETSKRFKRLTNLALTLVVFLICLLVFSYKQSQKEDWNKIHSIRATRKCLVDGEWISNSIAPKVCTVRFSEAGFFYSNSPELFENISQGNWSIVSPGVVKISSLQGGNQVKGSDHVFRLSACDTLHYATILFKKK